MAIGKPPPSALPAHNWRAADRTIAAGKHGHLGEPRQNSLALAWPLLGLVTPPQAFAEAERKASPNGASIIRFPAGCLRIFRAAKAPEQALRLRHLQAEAAGAALAERLFQLGEDGLEFPMQRPGR